MSLKPRPIQPVPDETARVARAAFPQGNVYLKLRDQLGTIFSDEDFAPLFPKDGQPPSSPWRLEQFERRLIQERTRAGLAAARARGRLGGRPSLDPQDPRVQMAKALYQDRTHKVGDICQTLHISRSTLYRYLALPDG